MKSKSTQQLLVLFIHQQQIKDYATIFTHHMRTNKLWIRIFLHTLGMIAKISSKLEPNLDMSSKRANK